MFDVESIVWLHFGLSTESHQAFMHKNKAKKGVNVKELWSKQMSSFVMSDMLQ